MTGSATSSTVANGDGSGWLPEAIRFIDLTPRNCALGRPLFMVSQLKKNRYVWLRRVVGEAQLAKRIAKLRVPFTIRAHGGSLSAGHKDSAVTIGK